MSVRVLTLADSRILVVADLSCACFCSSALAKLLADRVPSSVRLGRPRLLDFKCFSVCSDERVCCYLVNLAMFGSLCWWRRDSLLLQMGYDNKVWTGVCLRNQPILHYCLDCGADGSLKRSAIMLHFCDFVFLEHTLGWPERTRSCAAEPTLHSKRLYRPALSPK